MRKLLTIALVLICLALNPAGGEHKDFFWVSQTTRISAGEYVTIGWFVGGANNGELFQIIGNAQVIAGMPGVVTASAGAHNWVAIDSAGFAWTAGDNNSFGQAGNNTASGSSYGPTKILLDSAGNTFNNIVQVWSSGNAYGWNTWFLKADGTIWACGHIGTKLALRPVQMAGFPVGTFITTIRPGLECLALDSAGNVWCRGGGNQGFATPYVNPQGTATPDTISWVHITLPARCLKIAGGSFWNAAELANTQIYGWGPWPGFLGVGSALDSNSQHPTPSMLPTRIDTALGFTGPLIDIAVNNAAMFAITADSVGHAWGDATQGTIGNGAHMFMATYLAGTSSSPYFWNQSENPAQQLVRKPVIFLPGIHLAGLGITNSLCYCTYARAGNGQYYFFGRNKGGQAGNGVTPCDAFGIMAATYPNSWDVPWPIPVNPWTATNFGTTSPFCVGNPGGSQCSTTGCIIGTHANPVARTGAAVLIVRLGQTFTLDGTSSTAASTWGINAYFWQQTAGPSQAPPLPAFPQTPIVAAAVGTYTYQLTVTDNGWQTNSTTETVIVVPSNQLGPGVPGGRASVH